MHCDADGRFVFYNESAAALWGAQQPLSSLEAAAFANRNIIGRDAALVPEGHRAILHLASRCAAAFRHSRSNSRWAKAAETAVALARAEPLVSPGDAFAGAVGVLQDVAAVRQTSRLRDETPRARLT